MMLISIGDQIRSGTYTIHSRFKRVLNFLGQEGMVSLVDETIGSGPVNLVLKSGNFAQIGNDLYITEKLIFIDNLKYPFDSLLTYNSNMEFGSIDLKKLNQNIIWLEKLFLQIFDAQNYGMSLTKEKNCTKNVNPTFEHVFVARVTKAIDNINNGQTLAGIKKIKGCGVGLTPSGDDFIAGLLVGLNFIQKIYKIKICNLINEIYQIAIGGNIFSNMFLQFAKNGFLVEKVKKLLFALSFDCKENISYNLKSVLSIGASSGKDFAIGLLIALKKEANLWLSEEK